MATEITTTSDITVRLIQSCGGDWSVVAAAKVSTCGEEAMKFAGSASAEDNKGLIRYLMKMRHGTPFEHSFLSYFVHAPMFVWWEWVRHRIAHSFNLESSRYKQLDPVFYLPARHRPMMKAEGWKPGRPKFTVCEDDEVYRVVCQNLADNYREAYDAYEHNLQLGIDPGLARDCLPFGVYFSGWVTVNPRSLMAFLSLRTHEPAANHPSYPLYEIEEAARQCEAALKAGWPITYEAFCEFGREAP